MSLLMQVRPATLDDENTIQKIHYIALAPYHDFYAALFSVHPKDLLPTLDGRALRKPSEKFLVAVDSSTDKVVGYVRYQIVDVEEKESAKVSAKGQVSSQPTPPLVTPKEHLKDVWERFNKRDDDLDACREKTIQGQRHIWVKHLMIHPDQQRQGIGSKLLSSVVSVAEKHGLPIWLLSSKEGYGLYARLGFKDLGTFAIDNVFWAKDVARVESELGILESQGNGDLVGQYAGVVELERCMVRWPGT